MATGSDLDARRALVQAVAERDQGATKEDKRRALDQFVEATGYRKHSMRLLNVSAEARSTEAA
jgi:hypothetical protein